MTQTVFYAWQDSTDSKDNRYFIRDALISAIREIEKDTILQDAPALDHDTKDVSGVPAIADTIVNKIRDCTVFVADLSYVGKISDRHAPIPNPNVMIELGIALESIGWERIVTVMNLGFGVPEHLPFDIQHRRWPIRYSLGKGERRKAMRQLAAELKKAILAALNDPSANPELLDCFDGASREALNLAVRQPDYWEFRLTEQLLREGLRDVRTRLSHVCDGIEPAALTRALKVPEYLEWARSRMTDLVNMSASFSRLTNEELSSAWGAPGEPGDPIRIRRAVHSLVSTCAVAIDWERERRSVVPPSALRRCHEPMRGWPEGILDQVENGQRQIREIFSGEEPCGEHLIHLVLDAPTSLDEFLTELSRVESQPALWIDELD